MKKIQDELQSKRGYPEILTINPGSTSTKYKLFDMKGNVLAEHNFKLNEEKAEKKFLTNLENISKIGIRVVHGGDISKTSKITKSLKKKIRDYLDFAPIHNARALESIEKVEKIFPRTKFYACFDTAFHSTIAEELSSYALPLKLVKKHKLKKYGFHGLAVQSAYQKLKEEKKKKREKLPVKIVVAHLGGGASITAIKNGKSFVTSMGLTPLSGIMMTTRSGDVDPDMEKILVQREKKSVEDISHILNFKSGFYGLTGSKDTLKIFNRAREGRKREKLAFDIFISEIVEKIWSYAGLMQGIDAVVFSGGIGYGNKYLRDTVSKKLKLLGLKKSDIYAVDVDEEKVIFNELQKSS